jgi:hypothetical protein
MDDAKDTTFIDYLNLLLSEKDVNKRLNRLHIENIKDYIQSDFKVYIRYNNDFSFWIKTAPFGYHMIFESSFYDNDENPETLMSFDRVCYYLEKIGNTL